MCERLHFYDYNNCFKSLASKKGSLPQRIFEKCVCPLALIKLRTYDFFPLKRCLTNTPRRHRLPDGQLSSPYPPSPSFSSFVATSVMCYFLLPRQTRPYRCSSITRVSFSSHSELYPLTIQLRSRGRHSLRHASLPPSFPSSLVLSTSLPPSFPVSLPPPCLVSSALPRFLSPSLPPPCPSSISPPSRRFGSSCKASSWYVIFL